MNSNRFSIENENRVALLDKRYAQTFWPPASEYKLTTMNLSVFAPAIVTQQVQEELVRLEILIREDWKLCVLGSNPSEYQLINKTEIADSFRRLADLLQDTQIKKALEIRANAIERGYSDENLMELTQTNEDLSFIAGKIGTWSLKHSASKVSLTFHIADSQTHMASTEEPTSCGMLKRST